MKLISFDDGRGVIQMLCLPYAGGSASDYARWRASLPSWISLCALELPGRGSLAAKAPVEEMRTLAEQAADAAGPLLRWPYAVFGHSMGALLGYELCQRLTGRDNQGPCLFFASGHHAPHLPDPRPPLHQLSVPEFIDELRRLNGTPPALFESKELLDLYLPILYADFKACETYQHRSSQPLSCPIVVFGGDRDGDVLEKDILAWEELTSARFAWKIFPGDHFFLQSAASQVLRAISMELRMLKDSLAIHYY